MGAFTTQHGFMHGLGEMVASVLSVPTAFVAGAVDVSRAELRKSFPNTRVWWQVYTLAQGEGLAKPSAKALADRARTASRGNIAHFRSDADALRYVREHKTWALANPRGGKQMERAKVKHAATTKRRAARKAGTSKTAKPAKHANALHPAPTRRTA